jgi:DNA-binding protein HU-beta
MQTASKANIIDRVAADAGLTKAAASSAVDAALAAIQELTEAGWAVTLKGFGRFEMRERAERNGRNPATGEAIRIEASRHLAFKASKP